MKALAILSILVCFLCVMNFIFFILNIINSGFAWPTLLSLAAVLFTLPQSIIFIKKYMKKRGIKISWK